MPLVDSSTDEFWDSLYEESVDGVTVHYVRAARERYIGDFGKSLAQSLGLIEGNSVIIVGSGFGWIAEDIQALGISTVCCDSSDYIQRNLANNAVIEILNEDCLTADSRVRVLAKLGKVPDLIISEEVLGMLSDAEVQFFSQCCRGFGAPVYHVVTPGTRRYDDPDVWAGDPRLNWKTLSDWKSLVSPDFIISRVTAEII